MRLLKMASRSRLSAENPKGARNYKGKESEQSKKRRKKKSQSTAESLVEGIRSTPTNRMPTKGGEVVKKIRKFFKGH